MVTLRQESGSLVFDWPQHETGRWDTAMLQLTVDANDAPGPAIVVTVGATAEPSRSGPACAWTAVAEPQRPARGRCDPASRYGSRRLLRWFGRQTAELRLFDNQFDLGRRILVIAPHPDDAEIAAFGLYADRHSTVITITAGNAGDANYADVEPDQARQYELKGQLRAYDSVTVPWLGGVPPQRTANLGYFDAQLAAMYRAPAQIVHETYGSNTDVARYRIYNLSGFVSHAARTNTWQHLVEDLTAVLRQVRPDIIVMPDPRLDSHTDHEFTAVAVVQALAGWGGVAAVPAVYQPRG